MTTRGVSLSLLSFFVGYSAIAGEYAILPPAAGKSVTHQCSRRAPRDVTAFWAPSREQVALIERRLAALLAESGHPNVFAGSRRQYIGVTVPSGKQLIYVNAFPASAAAESHVRDWTTTAFTVCDGGERFWGVEFDPSDGTFLHLAFNGVG